MESNKNYKNNNDGDNEHDQLQEIARKHKFNELTNDGDKRAAGEEDQPETEDCSSSKKNHEDGIGLDLEQIVQLPHEKEDGIVETEKQAVLPAQQQMKIQLSLENWYDMLAFVPRQQLGQIVPNIGDRKFASIVQPFLHVYREIKIMSEYRKIAAPCEEYPGGPHVIVWQNETRTQLRIQMTETPMPANIKNFGYFQLSYFDQSVLHFLQKFQQNGLFDNVNLCIWELPKDIYQPLLCHLLPLVNGIVSVEVMESAQLVEIYDAGNSKEISELNMKMMEETRFLSVSHKFEEPENLQANRIDLYCRWLYQTPRADEKPRVLLFGRMDKDYSPVYLFINRLKHDFLMATDPVSFFVRINLPEDFQLQEDICLDNGKTKEKLLTKTKVINVPEPDEELKEVVLLISRYPLASTRKWTMENAKEVFNWVTDNDRQICLSNL